MEYQIEIERQKIEFPLVSVIVITYNSAKYVVETLDSIKNQSYNNFELIITDDCSTDETIATCQKWIRNNENLNFRVQLIMNKINSGISGNINKGLQNTNGKWVKIIAGDDILLPNCLLANVDHVRFYKANIIFSEPIYINELSEIIVETNNVKEDVKINDFYLMDAEQQYLHLLTRDKPMNPPTLFFNNEILDQLGGFDENFKIEDFPFYLNITKLGYKIFFFPEKTVKYRTYASSFSQKFKNNQGGISGLEIYKVEEVIKSHITWNLFFKHPLIVLDFFNRIVYIKLLVLTGNTVHSKKLFSFVRYLSPLRMYNKLAN